MVVLDVLFDTTRIQIWVVCSSTRMACFILLVRANSSPPELKSVLFPTFSGWPPHSAKREPHFATPSTRQVHTGQSVGQWKAKNRDARCPKFQPTSTSLHVSPSVLPGNENSRSKPPKGCHSRAEDFDVPCQPFQFFSKKPGFAPAFLKPRYA